MTRIVLAALVSLTSSCEPGVACTDEAVPGVRVTVFDASGLRVCSAVVVAKGAMDEETLRVTSDDPDVCTYSGLDERAGTFTLTATSARFVGQPSKTVTIERGECHVTTEVVELRAP